MSAATHPDSQTLAAYGLGRLPVGERAAVEAHVAGCPECCRALEQVGGDTMVGLARAAMETPILTRADIPAPADYPAALLNHPRYQMLARLGSGGMGTVYKALHKMMGRIVALKVVNPGLLADATALERFRKEVRLASKLDHPNIVTAYDADEAGGLRFLVMEYVEGVNLQELVQRKGPLPPSTACHLARQAALGLQHAAAKGMIHRDIKPQNLMVTPQGQMKILDFGLARMAVPTAANALRPPTEPDMVLGTPDFMAPEQARDAGAVDIRSDLYALGCTLYYLLTGRTPFLGDTPLAKLIAHAEDSPASVSASRPDVPAELDAVVAKLMAKDPTDRYQSPAEAVAALAPFAKSKAKLAPPVAEQPVYRRPVAPQPVEAPTLCLRVPRRKPLGNRSVIIGSLIFAGCLATGLIVWNLVGKRPESGAQPSQATTPGGVPAGSAENKRPALRIVILLASRNFWDPDYTPVRRALEREGCRVSVASSSRSVASPDLRGGGKDVAVDLALGNIKPSEWDAVIVCGGVGVSEYLHHNRPYGPIATQVLTQMRDAGKIVAALCMGPGVLADAGLLQGRHATGLAMVRSKPAKDVTWVDRPVDVDGSIVTGRDDQAAEAFAVAVLSELRKRGALISGSPPFPRTPISSNCL